MTNSTEQYFPEHRRLAPRLVLASSSVYRRKLLTRLNVEFQHQAPGIDETPLTAETSEALVSRLSLGKALAVGERLRKHLIVGSDQIVLDGERILGKPLSRPRAIEQLESASGRNLLFITGICLLNSKTGHHSTKVISTDVLFRNLSRAKIEAYLDNEKPYDCAGSFKSEGLGIALCKSITSDDPTALTGLPLITLVSMLQAENFEVLPPLQENTPHEPSNPIE